MALCMLAVASRAQMSPFLNDYENTLNGDDMAAISTASERLFDQQDGASDTWSNPKSGNGGSITVINSFTRDGMQCRKIGYDVRIAGIPETHSYTFDWCKTSNGWKIAPFTT
jgi:surface antigen